jgi:UDP-N-acetyl-D-glucosamine dehydrogenase
MNDRARTAEPASASDLAGRLAARIEAGSAVVGILGLGYVGLPLGVAVAGKGFPVIGFDIDRHKVDALNAGRSYIEYFADSRIAELTRSGRFRATADFAQIPEADILLICVPTPLSAHRDPDLSAVEATARSIAAHLRPGQLVVLESTTYPGTSIEVVEPILAESGLRRGEYFVAYSPEREDPGNPEFATVDIPKVVGGEGEIALALASAFYGRVVPRVVPVSSTRTAEAVKLLENIFRAVNIALVNELKLVFHRMGIDIWEVIESAKTKPFGYMPFYPGPGLGGHCIPIDPFYLTWKAREYGISTRLIELAGEINTAMPQWVVDRVAEAIDARAGKGLSQSRILIVGLAYKKNVDDVRESPACVIFDMLEARGAAVDYHDPHVPVIPVMRNHPRLAGRESVAFAAAAFAGYDAAVIVTDHDGLDYAALVEHVATVVDTRNVCARLGIVSDRIVRA